MNRLKTSFSESLVIKKCFEIQLNNVCVLFGRFAEHIWTKCKIEHENRDKICIKPEEASETKLQIYVTIEWNCNNYNNGNNNKSIDKCFQSVGLDSPMNGETSHKHGGKRAISSFDLNLPPPCATTNVWKEVRLQREALIEFVLSHFSTDSNDNNNRIYNPNSLVLLLRIHHVIKSCFFYLLDQNQHVINILPIFSSFLFNQKIIIDSWIQLFFDNLMSRSIDRSIDLH